MLSPYADLLTIVSSFICKSSYCTCQPGEGISTSGGSRGPPWLSQGAGPRGRGNADVFSADCFASFGINVGVASCVWENSEICVEAHMTTERAPCLLLFML